MKRFHCVPKQTLIEPGTGNRSKQHLFQTKGTVVKSAYVDYQSPGQSPDQDPVPGETDASPATQATASEQE